MGNKSNGSGPIAGIAFLCFLVLDIFLFSKNIFAGIGLLICTVAILGAFSGSHGK